MPGGELPDSLEQGTLTGDMARGQILGDCRSFELRVQQAAGEQGLDLGPEDQVAGAGESEIHRLDPAVVPRQHQAAPPLIPECICEHPA